MSRISMPSKATIRGTAYGFAGGALILVFSFPHQLWVLAIYAAVAWAAGVGYLLVARRAIATHPGEPTPEEMAESAKRTAAKLKRAPYLFVLGSVGFLLAAVVVPASDRRPSLIAAIVMLGGAVVMLAWVRKNE